MSVGSVHPESWSKAKQEGNSSSSKTKQGASKEPLLGRRSRMATNKKTMYLPPQRRVTNAKTDEERERGLCLECVEKFSKKIKCAPRDLYPLIKEQVEEMEGEVVAILVRLEEEQEATLQSQVLPDISVTIICQGVTDNRKVQDVNQTTKRLEEAVVPYRGPEKVDLLKRRVSVLKDLEILSGNFLEEKEIKGKKNRADSIDSLRSPSMASYYDPVVGGRPMNFRDVFLHSRVLEIITPSLNLEAPKEEISLLLSMFGVCLTGGKEAQNAIVSSVWNSIQVFAGYEDVVLVKKGKLFQFAQSAITGLKFNYGFARIDVEASWLKKKQDEVGVNWDDNYADDTTLATIEELKEAFNGYFSPLPIPYFYGTASNSEVEHVPRDIVAMLQLLCFHLHQGQRRLVQMVNPSFKSGHLGKSTVELNKMMDQDLRESRALDKESFCIIFGKMGWTIGTDRHIMDRGGNLVDAAKAVVLAGLLIYRSPECILEGKKGQEIIVQPPEAWESLPLIIRYLRTAVTMAILDDEGTVIIDPTHSEGSVLGKRITATVYTNGDDCAIQKEGGDCCKEEVNNALVGRPSGWDPYSKGTEAEFLRLSLMSRANSKAPKRQEEEHTGRHDYFMLDDWRRGIKTRKAIFRVPAVYTCYLRPPSVPICNLGSTLHQSDKTVRLKAKADNTSWFGKESGLLQLVSEPVLPQYDVGSGTNHAEAW